MPIKFNNNDKNVNLQKAIMEQKREAFKLQSKDIQIFGTQFVSDDTEEKDVAGLMGARFDGKINPTMQSFNTGDCWILAGVNSLNQTDWGRQIIKNSIKPDGKGGAVVTLKGAQGSQKAFHITAADMKKAEQNDKYSAGDNDMTAIELAVEKYAELKAKEGKLDKAQDELIDGALKVSMQELMTGKRPHYFRFGDTKLDEIFKKIEQNPGEYSIYTSFLEDSPPMYKEHAFTLKSIEKDKNGNKIVTLINPWDSSQTVTVPFEKYKYNMQWMLLSENPAAPDESLDSTYDKRMKIMKSRMQNRKRLL